MGSKQSVHSAKKSIWTIIVVLFCLGLCTYWLSAVLLERTQSPDMAYFNYLADAFLHGQTYINDPPATHDLTLYEGKWYVPFPPLPALLLLPAVFVNGTPHVNTVLLGIIMGSINIVLVFLILQSLTVRGWTQLRSADNIWLVVLFSVGSVHWYMSTLGSVWFVSQICTLTFILLAVLCSIVSGSPLITGIALALAILGRPHIILSYPLLLAIGIQDLREKMGKNHLREFKWGIIAFVPIVVSCIILLQYNYIRFENAFDFGYMSENVEDNLLSRDLLVYGQFNLYYVPHNVWAMLLAGPNWDNEFHMIVPNGEGMSLLITTPALIYILNARKRSLFVIGTWISLGLLLIPLLCYYNTGAQQFGYRFSLDFMTPVMILLAIGAGNRVGWKLRILILVGVIVNAWGVWWFLNPNTF